MTVKDILYQYQKSIMETYVNPDNLCLESLRLKYVPDGSPYEELIPALDERWCKKDHIYTLYTPPPLKSNDAEFTMGSKENWLERIKFLISDLKALLDMEYNRFWSEVLYNRHSLDGLYSFLQNAPPFYLREDRIPKDTDILKKYLRVQELFFLLLLRLTNYKEAENAWMKKSTLGIILYDNFIISLPQLMDICLIYARDNRKEISILIEKVIDIQPKYTSDIEKSVPFLFEVFSNFEVNLKSAVEINKGHPLISRDLNHIEVVKLIYLLLDIGYSLITFLEVYSRAGIVFHEQQLESRVASLYENTIPELNRRLESEYNHEGSEEQCLNYKLKLNLCRHQLILIVHCCLTAFLSTIIEERNFVTEEELKLRVESYINTLSDCVCDQTFIRDYNSAFPLQTDFKTLSQICPEIDTIKCEFLVESVMALYNLPPKQNSFAHRGRHESQEKAGPSSRAEYTQPQLKVRQVTGVELESLITEVKDILPHLGDGFVVKCLEHYNYVSADVINAVLESSLPDSVCSLDPDMPLIPSEENEDSNHLPERINIFDNDEFDIMTHNNVDTSRIHKGKRQEKYKNLFEMLDDKSHVNQLKDVYAQLSVVECYENANEYEDEYDDTYDDVDAPVGNEGNTEAEERRAFTIPRILQQQKKSVDLQEDYEDEDEEEENKGANNDFFIENPEEVRARAEQRRLDMRGRAGSGRSRAAFSGARDVVGKPKGQGQDKEVLRNRENKNTNKAGRGNHNRRAMAAKKMRQGMFPS